MPPPACARSKVAAAGATVPSVKLMARVCAGGSWAHRNWAFVAFANHVLCADSISYRVGAVLGCALPPAPRLFH